MVSTYNLVKNSKLYYHTECREDKRDQKAKALEEQGAKVGMKINATKTELIRICTPRCVDRRVQKIPTDVNPVVGHWVAATGKAQNREIEQLDAHNNCRIGRERAHVAGVKVTAQNMIR